MTDRPEESTIYWGDIHRSSTASGGKASMEQLKGPESTTNGKTPEGLDRIMDLHQISSSDWEKLQRLVEIFSLHVTCPH